MDTVALRPAQRPLLHLGLFLLTLLTTFEVFLSDQTSGDWNRANISGAVAFSLCLVAILGSHEMGHWLLARLDRPAKTAPMVRIEDIRIGVSQLHQITPVRQL